MQLLVCSLALDDTTITECLSARHCVVHSGQDRQQDLYVCIYFCDAFEMQLITREAYVFRVSYRIFAGGGVGREPVADVRFSIEGICVRVAY